MSKKEEHIIEPYTVSALLKDIHADFMERQSKVDKINVWDQYYLKLFQFLCQETVRVRDEVTTASQIDRSKIEQRLEADTFLFGYTFFLSTNPDYDYTWTYHLQKEKIVL